MKKKRITAPQIALPGMDTPTQQHSLFFALFPDEGTALRLAGLSLQLREKHGLRGQARPTNHLHLSLHHIGDYAEVPESVVTLACKAAEAVAVPPFELGFDRVLSFAGRTPRPFALLAAEGNAALAEFHRALGQSLTRVGLGRHLHTTFTPHLTLRYDDKLVAGEPVPEVGWTVQEFVLVSSLQRASHYERLGSWPLHGPFG